MVLVFSNETKRYTYDPPESHTSRYNSANFIIASMVTIRDHVEHFHESPIILKHLQVEDFEVMLSHCHTQWFGPPQNDLLRGYFGYLGDNDTEEFTIRSGDLPDFIYQQECTPLAMYLLSHGYQGHLSVCVSHDNETLFAYLDAHPSKNPSDIEYHSLGEEAVRLGSLGILRYLLEKDLHLPIVTYKQQAYMDGSLKSLRLLQEQDPSWGDSSITFDLLVISQDPKKLEIFKFATSHGLPVPPSLCRKAAELGLLEFLQHFHDIGFPFPEDIYKFVGRSGNTKCLEYLYEIGCQLPNNICEFAVSIDNRTEFIAFALNHGKLLTEKSLNLLIQSNSTDTLRFLRTLPSPPIFPIDGCVIAMRRNHFELLQFFHQLGYEIFPRNLPDDILSEVFRTIDDKDIIKYICRHQTQPWPQGFYQNIKHNKFFFVWISELLRRRHQEFPPFMIGLDDALVCEVAIQTDCPELLQFAHQKGVSFSEELGVLACNLQSYRCFQYLMHVQCPIDLYSCCQASKSLVLSFLQKTYQLSQLVWQEWAEAPLDSCF